VIKPTETTETTGALTLTLILRTLAGIALVALGLWVVSGAGPQLPLPAPYGRHAGWVAVAVGVWLIPFLRRNKRS
jgi:uncharacterized membrane protein YozB (DUF420 family)